MKSSQDHSESMPDAIKCLKRAYGHRSHNEIDEAFSECEKAIELIPNWADAHYLRGLLLEDASKKEEADESFLKAGQLDSSFKKMRPYLFEGEFDNLPSSMALERSKYPPIPWTYRDAWLGFLMFIGLSFVSYIVAGWLYWLLDIDSSWEILLVISELVFIVPVWWFVSHKYGAGKTSLGFRPFEKNTIGIGCGLVFAVNIFTVMYSAVVEYLFDSPMQPDLAPIADEMAFPWMLFAVVVIVAPVVEEVFFRGFLFAGLRQQYGWLKAALLSSALFALIHLQLYAIVPLFMLGFVFAYLFHKSNSIWPVIFLHFVVNLAAMIAEFVIDAD